MTLSLHHSYLKLRKITFIKLKYAKSGFYSMGVTLYNELPLNIRKIESFNLFRKNVLKIFNF